MRMYVIYDSLYEEYQMPFFMKNDNIARIEFDVFVRSMVEKAPEKEKVKTSQRFHLFYYPIDYNPETSLLCVTPDERHDNLRYDMEAKPLSIMGSEDDE